MILFFIEDQFVAPVITAGTPIILAAFSTLGLLFRHWLKRYEKRQEARLKTLDENQAQRVETIRHQVQNSHTVNLRDDLDEKFATLQATVNETRDHARSAAHDASRANARLDRQGSEIGELKKRLDGHIDG